MSPLSILFNCLQCPALVKVVSNEETDVDASLEYHLVDFVKNFCSIDSLGEVRNLFLLLCIQLVKQTKIEHQIVIQFNHAIFRCPLISTYLILCAARCM